VLNTAAWPELQLPVLTGIQLDPKNVRLETTSTQVEADILEDLFVNEGVLDLVDGISKIGYLTHDIPIVVKRRGKYVVVEGNRRLAALKAIQNPMLVPNFQARVAALSANIPDIKSLATIRVMEAPNQELANQLIAAIHTSNLRERWSPIRQAAFFQAQIDAGRKYADLMERYPTIDVRRFVFRAFIVNIFRDTRYDEPELNAFVKTREWKRSLSTLARIYESRQFLDITGFVMNDKGVVGRTVSDADLKAIGTIIVQGVMDGELNTRTLGTVSSPRFTRLMSELRAAAASAATSVESTPQSKGAAPTPSATTPAPTKNAPPTSAQAGPSGQGGGQSSAKTATSGQPPKSSAPKKSKVRFLTMAHLVPPPQYPVAIRLHLEELSALDVQKFPNMAFLMFRALIEKSIKAYAEAKGIDIKGTGNNTDGYVQLHHALKWLEQYVTQNGPKPMVQPVNQLRCGKIANYTASNDALNAINHNQHFHVDPDETLNCWNSIDSIMRELMKP
jgi:hypothetical protein